MFNKTIFQASVAKLALLGLVATAYSGALMADGFYPEWAAKAKYNTTIKVRDTDSALGRYSQDHKEFGLKDMVLAHGHMCDGLVFAYIEIKTALDKLFPDGIVDRTDLRVVAKNGPCLVDASALMTGARINFGTLSVDNSMGRKFIVQRISTGEAYEVDLRNDVFPKDLAELENKIRGLRKDGKPVSAEDIDNVEKLANEFIRTLLNTAPEKLVSINKMNDFKFEQKMTFGPRGDLVNKDMPRK